MAPQKEQWMENATLYQFSLCPYCHKVRAGLELKGIAYRTIEVNPMSKKELPALPDNAPRKVPVIELGGRTVFDSTDILKFLDREIPGKLRFLPEDTVARAKAEEVEAWVDDRLTHALPTVIYGTWGEALKAAQVTARTSNFGVLQNLMVRAGGSLIMHQVSRRILKKHAQTDAHAWLAKEMDQLEQWLGDEDFVCGREPTLGDVAVHGALTCIREFPAFDELMKRARVSRWFTRVEALQQANRALA
jgi:glutathione S-transferase